MDSSIVAQTAARWWANAACNPRFDNADDSLGGVLLALTAKSKATPISDVSDRFAEELQLRIEEKLNNNQNLFMQVDYGPDALLLEAAEASGLPINSLPIKTYMHITDGVISVSYGYGAPLEEVPIE